MTSLAASSTGRAGVLITSMFDNGRGLPPLYTTHAAVPWYVIILCANFSCVADSDSPEFASTAQSINRSMRESHFHKEFVFDKRYCVLHISVNNVDSFLVQASKLISGQLRGG